MMYGQMTAGSWIYIGSQGIVQGTYETFVEVGRQHYGGSLDGKWILTAGLGGMGGAQPLAATMAGASMLAVECQPSRIEMRLRTAISTTTAGSAGTWSPGLRRDRQPRPRVRRRLHDGSTSARGKETPLEAKLVRSVKTDGWISTDFHSHSSPSGDNTVQPARPGAQPALRAHRVRPLHRAQPALDLRPPPEAAGGRAADGHLRRDRADRPPAAPEPPERLPAGDAAQHPGQRGADDRRRPRDPDRAAGPLGRRQREARAGQPPRHRLDVPRPQRRRHARRRLRGHARQHGRHRGPSARTDLRRADAASPAGRPGTTRSSTGSSSSTRAGGSRAWSTPTPTTTSTARAGCGTT